MMNDKPLPGDLTMEQQFRLKVLMEDARQKSKNELLDVLENAIKQGMITQNLIKNMKKI